MARKNYKQRKGLSTIVGAIFMILVMVAALNLTLWTVQQQDRVTQTVIEKANESLSKLNEDIEISNARVSGNKLNLTATNPGGAATTIKSIYIVNETASPKEQYTYDLDLIVDGRDSVTGIGQSLPLIMDDADYSIRIVTESGNAATVKLSTLSNVALPMSIFIIPPTVTPTGSNVTVLFAVTNNMTESSLGLDVTPEISYSTSCSAGPSCQLTEHQAPASAYLANGNTVLFKWVFGVTMPDLSNISFNATLVGAKQGNYVTETALVKKIDESNVSESTTLVIHSDLLQKPEVFLAIPAPFGDNTARGLWSIIVSNPTEIDMTVSRIVITVYSSLPAQGTLDSDIFPDSDTCESAIYPNVASEWTCTHQNMLEWKDVANPEVVDPMSSKSFMAKVLPGAVEDEPAFMISVAVFTNMGQFTKTGFSSGIAKATNAMANVFMSTTDNSATAYQDSNIITHINGGASGSTMRFNVTVADFDTANDKYIKSGTRLVINIPDEFDNVTVVSSTGFSSAIPVEFSDGSTQITAELSENVGDVSGSPEAKVLSFTAEAPVVASEKIFLFYTLLDGEANPSNFSAGAFAQVPVQIIPPP